MSGRFTAVGVGTALMSMTLPYSAVAATSSSAVCSVAPDQELNLTDPKRIEKIVNIIVSQIEGSFGLPSQKILFTDGPALAYCIKEKFVLVPRRDFMIISEKYGYWDIALRFMLAHEIGHAVQYLIPQHQPNQAVQSELQADFFASYYIGKHQYYHGGERAFPFRPVIEELEARQGWASGRNDKTHPPLRWRISAMQEGKKLGLEQPDLSAEMVLMAWGKTSAIHD